MVLVLKQRMKCGTIDKTLKVFIPLSAVHLGVCFGLFFVNFVNWSVCFELFVQPFFPTRNGYLSSWFPMTDRRDPINHAFHIRTWMGRKNETKKEAKQKPPTLTN